MLQGILDDVRYAARGLVRTPLFTIVVALSLALGIGANTALYSVIDARYLRKLPVANPDELVAFRWTAFVRDPQLGDFVGIIQSTNMSRVTLDALTANAETLAAVFAYTYPTGTAAVIDTDPEAVQMQFVSGNYFQTLGVAPAAGRLIDAADDSAVAARAVVISARFWERRLASDPAAVGRTVTVNGVPATVVGVVAPEFRGTSERGLADILIPLAFEAQIQGKVDPAAPTLQVMARAKPGVTPEQVRGNVEGLLRDSADFRLPAAVSPVEPPRLDLVSASRGEPTFVGGSFLRFVTILGAVFGLLLVIVCLNVANMLLARAATREYELGVRLALGASRRRLVRHLLTESILVAVLGGLIGVVVAYWSKDLLTLVLARDFDLRIDVRALAFTAAISLSTGLLVGLVPALQASAFAVRRKTARSHLNRTSLVIQVAMSVVLMIGAGLLLRTLGKLPHDDPGFDADNLLIFRVDAPNAYDAERTGVLYEQILERVASLPGVEAATFSSAPLISTGSYWGNILRPVDGGLESSAVVRELGVHPSFFSVTGLPILRGRALTADDRAGAPLAAVLSENAARKLFGSADPIGRRALLGGLAARWLEVDVVGVVPDVGLSTLGDDTDGSVFLASAQVPAFGPSMDNTSFSVRVSGNSAALVPALHEAVRALDPDLPVFGMTMQTQLIDERVGAVYRVALTWTLLGGLAVVLTSIGLYGLMAYSAARRTNEIGVRLALGARPLHVIRLVMGQSLVLVGIGIAIGAIASLLVSQTIRVFVFGVTVYDPLTMVAVVLAILGVTALAGYLPARRASSVDPCIALRYE